MGYSQEHLIDTEITRRNFIGIGAAAAACGAAGLVAANSNVAFADEAGADQPNIDWLGEAPEISDEEIVETQACDILIIGAGNAGMTAAVRAAELGLDFILADKATMPSTERGFLGAINDATAQADGFTEDPYNIVHELVRYSSGKANSKLLMGWAKESGACLDWAAGIMDAYGFDVAHNTDIGVEEKPAYYCGAVEHSFNAREDSEWADGNRHTVFLDYIQQRGYDISGGMDLAKLIQDENGAVTGAIFATEAGYVAVEANNVLISTGGYADNPDMLMAIGPEQCKVIAGQMIYPGNTGMGIKAAMWAGADKDSEFAPMLFDRSAVAPGTEIGFHFDGEKYACPVGLTTTQAEYNPGTQPFLKINRRGERFANESGPYTDISLAATNQPGNTWCQIFDSSYAEDWEQFHTLGCSSMTRKIPEVFSGMIETLVENGVMMKADTIEELGASLGLDEEGVNTFVETVARYNELTAAGEDEDFGKPAYRMSMIDEPPYYGVWLGCNILTTLDGIKINEKCQALNVDHEVIPGLYVAGDASGSFFVNNYPYLLPGIAAGRTMYEAKKAIDTIAGV